MKVKDNELRTCIKNLVSGPLYDAKMSHEIHNKLRESFTSTPQSLESYQNDPLYHAVVDSTIAMLVHKYYDAIIEEIVWILVDKLPIIIREVENGKD